MNMAIDAGNSLIKIGIFDKNRLQHKNEFTSTHLVKKFLQEFPVDNLILGSVTSEHQEVLSLARVNGTKIILTHRVPLPIINKYTTPETLGVDRLAAACGAW